MQMIGESGLGWDQVRDLTFREFYILWEGRINMAWNRTAPIVAELRNIFSLVAVWGSDEKPKLVTPEQIHPFVSDEAADRGRVKVTPKNFSLLKHIGNVVARGG